MDGLSVAASIIAVLQLTGEVIKYLNDVRDAPKECQRCMTEASNLQNLLINLLYHLNQGKTGDPWYIAFETFSFWLRLFVREETICRYSLAKSVSGFCKHRTFS